MQNLVRDIQQMNKHLLKILLHSLAVLSQKWGNLSTLYLLGALDVLQLNDILLAVLLLSCPLLQIDICWAQFYYKKLGYT